MAALRLAAVRAKRPIMPLERPCWWSKPTELGGKAPPIQRYRIWPLLSHNPCSRPDRGARDATPRFHDFTRGRNWWRAIRRACAAEGSAGDRDPRRHVARNPPGCGESRGLPPGIGRDRYVE